MLFAILASCASLTTPGRIDVEPLRDFFRLCESDLEKAKQVIIDRDLIKNLTHLRRMDNGGKKYYLLERESITAMIKSVTEGVYSDFILVNRDGTVVYTMDNDGLFGWTARAGTALGDCLANRDTVPYISGAFSLPADPERHIAVSSKVSGGNTMPGIFILLVDIRKIRELVGKQSFIVDARGNYEVAGDNQKINTPYGDFEKIDLSRSGDELAVRRFSRSAGGSAWYRFFRYSNLLWIVVTE